MEYFESDIIQGIKEIIQSNLRHSPSVINDYIENAPASELFPDSLLAKTTKEFLEKAILNEVESKVEELADIQKTTWKIDAHNIAKDMLDLSSVSTVKHDLNDLIKKCVDKIYNEMKDTTYEKSIDALKQSVLSDNSTQLIPPNLFELSQLISGYEPTNVRIKAYEFLCSSYYADDIITKKNWDNLQCALQEGLKDHNMNIFSLCLKFHAKLFLSSFDVMKEMFLNLLDCLCQYYNEQETDCVCLSLTNNIQVRMVRIMNLVIKAIYIIVQNVARFGLKRLEEVIDNFIHILTIHKGSKTFRTKCFLSPFEIISCLDPGSNWCVFLTYGVISRNILLSNNNNLRNKSLLQLVIEIISEWLSKPLIPDKLDLDSSEINSKHIKFAVFVHSLSVFSTICQYDMGRNYFPLFLNKNEEYVSISDVTEKVLTFLNRTMELPSNQNKQYSKHFLELVEVSLKKLFKIKDIQTTLFLHVVRPLRQNPPKLFAHSLTLLNVIEMCDCSKHLMNKPISSGRKRGSQLNKFTLSASSLRNRHCTPSSSRQSLCVSSENNFKLCLIDILFSSLIGVLESIEMYKMEFICQLIKVVETCLSLPDNLYYVKSKENKYDLIKALTAIFKKISSNESIISSDKEQYNSLEIACCNIFLQIGTTSFGIYLLKCEGATDLIIRQGLGAVEIPWICYKWRSFISHLCQYADEINLMISSNQILIKHELLKLWDVVDKHCSDSEILIQESIELIFLIAGSFGISVNAVRRMFGEQSDNESDVTITEDVKIIPPPTSIAMLMQNFALSIDDVDNIMYHLIALSVLQIFVSNLDTNLYLQHYSCFQDHLLKLQAVNRVDEDSSEVIIDEASSLRHKILEQSYFPRNCRSDAKLYFTPPQVVTTLHRIKVKSKTNGEYMKFLQDTKTGLHDMNWLKQARKVYRMSSFDEIKTSTLIESLEQVRKCFSEVNNLIKWVPIEVAKKINLLPEDLLGVQFVLRYGAYHRLIQPTPQNAENLVLVISLIRASLGINSNEFVGFDWFAATVFLICSGNVERCQNFLIGFSFLPTANYVWPSISKTFNKDLHFAILGQVVDTIALKELPSSFHTLKNHGISWWLICQQWIKECFWNTLEWQQVCHWVMLCILQQPEYIIYFCVALLQANEQYILKLSRENSLHEIIVNPITRYQKNDMLQFMDKLCRKYQNILTTKINSII
uniref:Protein broad-minded n=1 Tax=Clastoptera arizonana TaxID=38151 RepID=A0A1B6DV25_9HEMI